VLDEVDVIVEDPEIVRGMAGCNDGTKLAEVKIKANAKRTPTEMATKNLADCMPIHSSVDW